MQKPKNKTQNKNFGIKNFSFFILLFTFYFLLFGLGVANATEFSISPVVVDEKAKARDILKKNITLINTTSRKLNIYPWVNNINPQSGEEDFEQAHTLDDRKASLANWIEISRGVVVLDPGEKKIIPFVINVNLNALPGNYHAQISFADGSNRTQAEESVYKAVLSVNLEVLEDIREEMQLTKFTTDRIFFSGDDVLFDYQLENIGNSNVLPEGEVRIYNGKGEEVAVIDANKSKKSFTPDKIAQLASVWNAGSGFGKYKAFLNLNYGEHQRGSIQDTVFFWVIPWKMLASVFVGSLIAVIVFASLFHRWLERRQLRFAPVMVGDGIKPLHEVEPPVEEPKSFKKRKRFLFFNRKEEESSGMEIQPMSSGPVLFSEPSSPVASPPAPMISPTPSVSVPPRENQKITPLVTVAKPKVPMHEHPFLKKVYADRKGDSVSGKPGCNGSVINLKEAKKQQVGGFATNNHVIDLRNK